jgi:NitT/TauT family transport system substrate-binding protein
VSVKAKAPTAKMLVDASEFPSATIVDGWAARNDFHETQKDVLKRFIRAWVPANDFIVNKPKEALRILHDKYYSKLALTDVEEMFRAAKWYSSTEWAKYFKDGSAVKWLNQVTQFNVDVGAMENPMMADKYFDPSLYLDVVASLSSN